MTTITIADRAGSFAENKDVARDIRVHGILPGLADGNSVTLNFQGVEATTQSFIHALLSDVLRKHGSLVLDRISFQSCNDTVKKLIEIVVGYMQESGATDGDGDSLAGSEA